MDGTSWADQWDYGTSEPYRRKGPGYGYGGEETKKGQQKYKEKVNEGLQKTKTMASTGFKKVKHGTTLGLHWVKDKYHKTTQKH